MNPTNEANLTSEPAESLAALSDERVKGSRIISKVLSPAIRLWLCAQVEVLTGLTFQIQGSDREILRGCVPKAEVRAEQIVYQGLHLSHVDLTASQIRINLGQVLQGKPLRLLEVVPVVGTVKLNSADLDASVNSSLLKQALADFLALVVRHADQTAGSAQLALLHQPFQIEQSQVQLAADQLTLDTDVLTSLQQRWHLRLQTKIRLSHGSCLQFTELEMHCTSTDQNLVITSTQPLEIDLGSEVHLHKLEIDTNGVLCQGKINVAS